MFLVPAVALLVSLAQSPQADHFFLGGHDTPRAASGRGQDFVYSIGGQDPATAHDSLRGLGYSSAQPRAGGGQDQAPQRRGWLGVSLNNSDGSVEVAGVVGNSPAERAQLRAGDRVTAVAGTKVESFEDLIKVLRAYGPGQTIELALERDVKVELSDAHKEGDRYLLGLFLGEPVNGKAEKNKAKQKDKDGDQDKSADARAGVAVTRVGPGYPAARAGIAGGDVVLSVEGRPVDSSESVIAALADVHEATTVTVRIARQRKIELGNAPNAPVTGQFFEVPAKPRSTQPALPRTAQPPAAAEAAPQALEEELRALSQELRELREQVARLRSEIDRLRTR